MAEHHQAQHQGRQYRDVAAGGQRDITESIKGILPEKGPSASQIVAVVSLFPIGGFLLLLAGLTLAGTLTGLAVTTPLFVIFSPVLVPAALVIGLAVTGFLTSGAFGITALSALSWIINNMRRMRGSLPEQMDYAKRRAQDTAGYLGQRTKDLGQTIQSKAHEGGRAQEGART